MNVQEKLIKYREVVDRLDEVPEEYSDLLTIAETQNACIKMLRFMQFKDVEKFIVSEHDQLNNKTPIQAIEEGNVGDVYRLIDEMYNASK